ncbi:MAG: hypothetical protein K1X83_09200 [Oligoflexia bacterium]|nr:hypothetical protein [Oligoflexia bacterium]
MNRSAQTTQPARSAETGGTPWISARAPETSLEEVDVKAGSYLRQIEALGSFEVASSKAALDQLAPILSHAEDPGCRAFLVKAMRTVKPKQFAYDEARAAVFEALAPFSTSDSSVVPLLFEELEHQASRSISTTKAIEILNQIPTIEDPRLTERALKIFTNRTDPLKPEVLDSLTVRLKPLEDSTQLKELRRTALKCCREADPEGYPLLQALALTRNRRCIDTLTKIAKGTTNGRLHIQDFGFYCGMALIGSLVGGCIALEGGMKHGLSVFFPGALVGAVVVTLGAIPVIGRPRIYREIRFNEAYALKAVQALGAVGQNAKAEDALSKILLNPKNSYVMRAAAADSLSRISHLYPERLIAGLRDPADVVRELCLTALAKSEDPKVKRAIHNCIDDSCRKVQLLAYEILERDK